MKRINWPDIWLEIAEAYGTPCEERTETQRLVAMGGLCWALRFLRVYDSTSTFVCMEIFHKPGYWWQVRYESPLINGKFKPIYDTYRCQFACFLAAMSNKEFKDLLKSKRIEITELRYPN